MRHITYGLILNVFIPVLNLLLAFLNDSFQILDEQNVSLIVEFSFHFFDIRQIAFTCYIMSNIQSHTQYRNNNGRYKA